MQFSLRFGPDDRSSAWAGRPDYIRNPEVANYLNPGLLRVRVGLSVNL